MEPSEIRELVRAGESQDVEFKTTLRAERDIAKQISAFANSGGGTILVGADERGIHGLSDQEAAVTARRISGVAGTLLPRPPAVQIQEVDGKNVVAVTIPPIVTELGPVMTADGAIYQRVGDRSVPQSRPAVKPPTAVGRSIQLFVAMSFRLEDEPALIDYFEAIKRAVKATGYPIEVRRMDLIEGDYEITERIEDEIRAADIILTDYTLSSPNVFYEAGFAKALGKRMIRCARKDSPPPFDLRQYRTLIYVNATQLEAKLLPEITQAISELSA